MEAESAATAVGEPALEREADGAERDLLPRNLGLLPERNLETFLAGLEFESQHARPVEKVHLVHVRYRDHGERRAELDPRAGFLERLAQRRFGRGLVVLHEARGQGPVAVA